MGIAENQILFNNKWVLSLLFFFFKIFFFFGGGPYFKVFTEFVTMLPPFFNALVF